VTAATGETVKTASTFLCIIFFASLAFAQTTSKPAAIVNGQTITEAQVTKAASPDLNKLPATATQSQKLAVMWKALDGLIADKLLTAEAVRDQKTKAELIQSEVDSDLPHPPDQVVETYYEFNKSRFPEPHDKALEKVRDYLFQRTRRNTYDNFIHTLAKQYGVKTFLEPLRKQVATTGYPSQGPAAALVTIVEFSDFECPYCNNLMPTLKLIEKNYGDKVRVVYRQFPLPWVHPHALKAAEASLCANDQHRFWEFHDALFSNQRDLTIDGLKRRAADLKLDTAQFNTCLDSAKEASAVQKDIEAGHQADVEGTPTVFINGRMIYGTQAYADLKEIIDDELQRKK
jgi:protein-disulfide isomerase